MYNGLMPEITFEVRICDSCGLRYPMTVGHRFGSRCPVCLGETRLAIGRQLLAEPTRAPARRYPSKSGLAVLLDNIRSAGNVGSILRSADGFGFTQAYLCGITPTPDHEAVLKTSLGAEDSVPWSYHKDAVRLVKGLKKEGFKIHALEEHPRAIDVCQAEIVDHHSVIVAGNEVTGVDPELIDLCDEILYIPLYGEKRSFNVAIAFSIAAYALGSK